MIMVDNPQFADLAEVRLLLNNANPSGRVSQLTVSSGQLTVKTMRKALICKVFCKLATENCPLRVKHAP